MPFSDFHGNQKAVTSLREMLLRNRFPQAVILSGPSGCGKYTLALMLAKAMNCLTPTMTDGLPDFCGQCSNCVRIAQSENLDVRLSEAVETRENLRETDKKDTRLFVQTHPDVLIVPPDPPQMMIKVDQVRKLIETIYFRPAEAIGNSPRALGFAAQRRAGNVLPLLACPAPQTHQVQMAGERGVALGVLHP
jgi:DNA polymerase III subunit delta'